MSTLVKAGHAVVPARDLAQALTHAIRLVGRETKPIVDCVRIEGRNNALIISATNLRLRLDLEIPAEVEGTWVRCVPVRPLYQYARLLPATDVQLQPEGEHDLTLRWAENKAHFEGRLHDQFPAQSVLDEERVLTVGAVSLRRLLDKTYRTVAKDEARPYLEAICLTVRDGVMQAVTTDSVRVSWAEAACDGPDMQFLLPSDAARELLRLLRLATPEIRLATDGERIVFRMGSITVTTNLIISRYPDVPSKRPKQWVTQAYLDRVQLLGTLLRVGSLPPDRTVRRTIREGGITVLASVPQVGQVRETIPGRIEGKPLDMGWNARLIIEILSGWDCPKVRLDIAGAREPMRMIPLDQDGEPLPYGSAVLPLITYETA